MNTTSIDSLQERRALFRERAISIFKQAPRLYECQGAVETAVSKTFNRLRILERGRRLTPNDDPFYGPRYSRLPLVERERIVLDLYVALDEIDLPLDDAEAVTIDSLVDLVS